MELQTHTAEIMGFQPTFTVESSINNIKKPFVEANTEEVSLSFLKNSCIIPVFTKDNETTLSHQEFIESVRNAIKSIFPNEIIEEPEIRVSHQIKGRTPDAIHIPVKDLQEHQKINHFRNHYEVIYA
jgi:hypothetical protein